MIESKIESKDIAERAVYYFRTTYGLGEKEIKVDPLIPEKVNYRDFSFVVDYNEEDIDVTMIPPRGSEDDFEAYLMSTRKGFYYKKNLGDKLKKNIHSHRRRFVNGEFEVDEVEGFHYRAKMGPKRDPLFYLDNLTLAVIDCVIRPAMIFGRHREHKLNCK